MSLGIRVWAIFFVSILLSTAAHGVTGSGDSAIGVLDTVAPSVTGITVTSSASIEVAFDEPMLSGIATDPANYTLSGVGAGTLSVHPDTVTGSGPYTLTWATGEMTDGAALTITAAGVQDAAGNLIGATNAASANGLGDAPSFNTIGTSPASASVGEAVQIYFTASEPLAGDPTVTVNGHPATYVSNNGLDYLYAYTVLPADALGAAAIVVSGTDLAANAGETMNSSALTISSPADNVPLAAWPLALLLPLAALAAIRRRSRTAVVALFLALAAPTVWAAAPVVTNVIFSQHASGSTTTVDIYYDLSAPGPACDVTVTLSKDGGTDGYPYAVTSVTGDVVGVTTGTGHHITWDIATDYPGENIAQARLRVTANDGAIDPVLNSFSLDNGAATSFNRALTLDNTASNVPLQYQASLLSDFSDATWQPYDTAPSFVPGPVANGITVYFKVRNSAGESNVLSDTIDYFPFDAPETLPVASGTFSMGDLFGGGDSDELPVHDVTLSAYEIGKYEITNRQFADVLNWANAQGYLTTASATSVQAYGQDILFISDSACQIEYTGGRFAAKTRDTYSMDDHPVVDMSWYGAAAFCNWASQMLGLTPCFNTSTWACDYSQNGYKMPTEAQWEFAAAYDPITPAPTSDHWFYGFSADAIDTTRCNYLLANPLGLTSQPFTTPVGYYDGVHASTSLSTSPVGAFDMSGNVDEFCSDWIEAYPSGPVTDPVGAAGSGYRAVRGGAFIHGDFGQRTNDRVGYVPFGGDFFVGFRISR